MEIALERTSAANGALFLWDPRRKGLVVRFHVVGGLAVEMPASLLRPRRDGRPNGIALHVMETGKAYLTGETDGDPHYSPYFLPVRSIAAVPIRYGRESIGVITVSAREPSAFDDGDLGELGALAGTAAKYLRRAQLHRASLESTGRPFLIKGLSPGWLEVERRMEQVAGTDAPVLVHGESGTGKELVTRAIHFNSRRANAPLVTVNCAAIPEAMLESMLFGHVRGAFTGASFDKIGEMKKAHGGTLFLDELGELPMSLQAKVLRAVELGEIQPIGSNKPPERVDVRLVCATHRDLAAMVRDGRFRDDLYYRLAVMRIEIPPLRSYRDNLEVLAHVFRQQAADRHRRAVTRISPDAMARLHAYDFPGNVRELKNAIEHAVILAPGDEIRAEDLPESITGGGASVAEAAPAPSPASRQRTLREMRETWLAPFESAWLAELLAACGGNVRLAAKTADVDPVTLYRLLARRGVRRR